MTRRTARRVRLDRSAWLLLVLAAICVGGMVLVPDWERRLHAQDYGLETDPPAPGQGESDRDRKTIEQQLEVEAGLLYRWGLFLTLHHNQLDLRDTDSDDQEIDLSSNKPGFLAGFDYQYSRRLLIGWALGFNVSLVDVDRENQRVQDTTIYTYRTGPYLKYEGIAPWYVYTILLADVLDVHNKRRAVTPSDAIRSDTLGGQLDLSVAAGYDFTAGPLRYGPVGSFNYRGLWMDGYTESGSAFERLRVDDLAVHQIGFRAGGAATYGFPMPWGLLAPQVRVVGVYENLVDRGPLTSTKVVCPIADCEVSQRVIEPDQFFMELGLGISLTLPERWTCSLSYQDNFFRDRTHESYLAFTVRRQF